MRTRIGMTRHTRRAFRRAVCLYVAAAPVLLLLPASALAAGHGPHGGGGSLPIPFGLFGISISGILKTLAKDLFNILAGALLPGWLKNAPQNALRWLIALPDPADPVQWPTMGHLEQDTTAVAVAFLPVTLAVAAARYTASGVTGGVHHPVESLTRLVAAAAGLLLLPWGFRNAVAAVNVTTSALLSFAGIDHGLQRALTLMFAGGLAFGVTGPLVALLVIAAIFLAVGLLIIKVGVLALFAILFVAGPLALAGYPIPELHGAWRLLLGLLLAAAMIPIGWCLIFAVAGAISADVTHIGTPAAIGTRLVGFFAGILTFFIAFRWPFFLIGLVRARGLFSADMLSGSGAVSGAGGDGPLRRAQEARTALLAGAATGGSAISHVGGALGMPAGGLVAGAGRLTARHAGNLPGGRLVLRSRDGLANSWRAVRQRASQHPVASTRVGRRVAGAGAVAAAAPAAVLASARERGSVRAGRAAGEAILESARSGRASAAPDRGESGPREKDTASPRNAGAPPGRGAGGNTTHTSPAPGRAPGSSAAVREAVAGGAVAGVAASAASGMRSGPAGGEPRIADDSRARNPGSVAHTSFADATRPPGQRPRKPRPGSTSTPPDKGSR